MKKLAILFSFLAVSCTSSQGYNYDEGALQASIDLIYDQECKYYVGSTVKDIRDKATRKILDENDCTYLAANYNMAHSMDQSLKYYEGYNNYVIEYFTEKDY